MNNLLKQDKVDMIMFSKFLIKKTNNFQLKNYLIKMKKVLNRINMRKKI